MTEPERDRRRKLLTSAVGVIAVVAFVLISAPWWPDGPVKSAAMWIRDGLGSAFDNPDLLAEARTTSEIFGLTLEASEGYFLYLEDSVLTNPSDGSIGDLVDIFSGGRQVLRNAQTTAETNTELILAEVDSLEVDGVEELKGVPHGVNHGANHA